MFVKVNKSDDLKLPAGGITKLASEYGYSLTDVEQTIRKLDELVNKEHMRLDDEVRMHVIHYHLDRNMAVTPISLMLAVADHKYVSTTKVYIPKHLLRAYIDTEEIYELNNSRRHVSVISVAFLLSLIIALITWGILYYFL